MLSPSHSYKFILKLGSSRNFFFFLLKTLCRIYYFLSLLSELSLFKEQLNKQEMIGHYHTLSIGLESKGLDSRPEFLMTCWTHFGKALILLPFYFWVSVLGFILLLLFSPPPLPPSFKINKLDGIISKVFPNLHIY